VHNPIDRFPEGRFREVGAASHIQLVDAIKREKKGWKEAKHQEDISR